MNCRALLDEWIVIDFMRVKYLSMAALLNILFEKGLVVNSIFLI